ncbi:PREDICTED: protein N-lysine methyltransferase METTL21A isoform X2 [Lupinus angustifolius]|uniref:protein N-lysine methyltransferase METTL21A isoform X2 n=1 Tax=Lupinus angustifolius TaxID=3871 RepID=UPI00092F65ED|nr:PREDICTED: protein N-lysine methyltransferase METTL21A isoform X2 [Lupinus angustifolius]
MEEKRDQKLQHHQEEKEEEEEEEIVCLDESFFINDDYQLTNFTFGSQQIQLFCLHSASTDFDLTGQLVWPGAMLLNDYLSKNVELLQGRSVIELGSGVGITGILCSGFCHKFVLTDHNDEVLKIINKNIKLHSCSEDTSPTSHGLVAEKLEWGNKDQINEILQKHPGGFDFILGADICFQQSSIPPLFGTVNHLLRAREGRKCKFILAYVSRSKTMDSMIITEASKHQMHLKEVLGTRTIVGNLEGVIYETTLE